jgi:glycyl-tRNA synthetase
MAHYAKDCWDAEAHTTYGWVEIVGHADRAAYDLQAHSKVTKQDLTAFETYDQPREVEVARVKIEKGKVGPKFGANSRALILHLEKMEKDAVIAMGDSLAKTGSATVTVDGKDYVVTPDLVKTSIAKERVSGEKFVPSVIEPSFGIGRIMYSIFEHSYTQRAGDAQRSYLALPAIIAPVKVAILPISTDEKLEPFAAALAKGLLLHNLATKTDSSGVALGRKYARAGTLLPIICVCIALYIC